MEPISVTLLRAAELEIAKDASFVFKGENGFELESGDYMIQGNKKDRNKINIFNFIINSVFPQIRLER